MTRDDLSVLAPKLEETLRAAGVSSVGTSIYSLGGPNRASLAIYLSLDYKGGIFENSQHAKLMLNTDGRKASIEYLTGHKMKRLRKKSFELANASSWEKIAEYLLTWLRTQ